MIVKMSSDITSCCMTDLKVESSRNAAGRLFCSTCDGQIFAILLGSYLYVMLIVNSAGFPLVLKSLEKCLNFTHSNSRPLKVLKNDNGA